MGSINKVQAAQIKNQQKLEKQAFKNWQSDVISFQKEIKGKKSSDLTPAQLSKLKALQSGPAKQEEPPRDMFDQWMNKCADSMTDVDTNGKPVYGEDVADFDMAGEEFTNDITNNNGENAGEIYKEKSLKVAQDEISLYDTDGDGSISMEEQVTRELSEAQKKYGDISPFSSDLQLSAVRMNKFIDLNADGKVDDKEMASYLYAMDGNNEKNVANGKISREEYGKSSLFFTKPLDEEAGTFRGSVKACFKSLFGN